MPLGDVQRRFLRFAAFSALVLIGIKMNFGEGGQCCKKMRCPCAVIPSRTDGYRRGHIDVAWPFRVIPPRVVRTCQNSLSCAPCCTALSLTTIRINESADARNRRKRLRR